uniref:ABC-2 type transporter transmembrane domain-containing protein n=1 Tax=Alexandrium catenella TaxID=2925 RepID=A0A7S1LJC4_ALECA
MLDDVMILHDGEVCFHGDAEGLVGHFEQLGFPCPPNYNPADRVLFLIQQESAEVVRSIKDKWLESGSYQALLTRIERAREWSQAPHGGVSSSESSGSSAEEDACCKADKADALAINKHHKGCCATIRALFQRELRGNSRAWKPILFEAVIGNFMVALVYGALFFRKGHQEDSVCEDPANDEVRGACQRSFQVHLAVLSMIAINVMFAAHAWASEVLQGERAVFLRERAGGYYKVFPYILAKTTAEVPLIYSQVLSMLMGAYWLVGLRGNFFFLSLEMLALALTSSSVMYCATALASTRAQAGAFAMLPQILQFAFSGVLLPIQDIPVFLQWIKWLCPLYYGLGMLSVTEFQYLYAQRDACPSNATCPGVQIRLTVLDLMDVHQESFLWPNLAMCSLLFVGLRLLSVAILWRKSRYVL